MPYYNDGYQDYYEDEDLYSYDYDEGYDDDPDYDYAPWPDPEPSLLGRIKRLVNRLKLRWYLWRHSDEISDIPF